MEGIKVYSLDQIELLIKMGKLNWQFVRIKTNIMSHFISDSI